MTGRHISDNILLCQELLHDYHAPHGMARFAAKLDIRKAFDSVNWSFLFSLLHRLNFPPPFLAWVVECITNPSFVVALNGEQSRIFSGNRSLRQGCPLSPALFSIVLQFFSDSLELLATLGHYQYHAFCAQPGITLLCFADDLFIFGKATIPNAAMLQQCFDDFSLVSGLTLNQEKSHIFFANYSPTLQLQILALLGIPAGSFPITYLGVPISSKKLKPNDFEVLTTRVQRCLASWRGRVLSFASRLQLIRSVLYGTISYWLNVFKLPSGVMRRLERLMAKFLWRGHSEHGSHKVAWHSVCMPKEEGGLGLRRLADWNQASLMRHIWSLSSSQDSCWVSFILARWLHHHSLWSLAPPSRCSATWKAILDTRSIAQHCIRILLRDGSHTLVWHDPWLAEGPLHSPALLLTPTLGRDFFATVNTLLSPTPLLADPPNDPAIQTRWTEICSSRCFHRFYRDTFVWTPTSSGRFNTKSAWNATRISGAPVSWHRVIWAMSTHPRFSFIAWLADRQALTLRTKLAAWGISTIQTCYLCNLGNETFDHLFFACPYTGPIWAHLLHMCGYNRAPIDSWQAELTWVANHFQGRSFEVRIRQLCFSATIYRIWAERNQRAFQNAAHHHSAVIHSIIHDTKTKFSSGNITVLDNPGSRNFLAHWNITASFSLGPETPFFWLAPPPGWTAVNCDGSVHSFLWALEPLGTTT
ncbi:uncharacterized protein LOC122649778 [Telopea speciosissima]|uniref:uncharacterized protein LOC122649778 n=1 Tax=Telopea speciosissima TaxID=54955 RepID=UPI001CC78375|nr:uncharacterized protein LOC122649778 [Telopea speciosissima]